MEAKYTAFCVRCKEKVEVIEPELTETKGSRGVRKAVKGKCPKCQTKVYVILKNDGSQNNK